MKPASGQAERVDPALSGAGVAFRDAPHACFVKDRTGRCVFANEAAAGWFGRPVNEVVGKKTEELMPAEAARAIELHDRVVLEEGRTSTFEVELPTPEGPRFFRRTAWPIRDAQGNVAGLAGLACDVTDERRLRAGELHGRSGAERFAALKYVTDAALTMLAGETLIQELLGRVREIFAADTTTVLLVRQAGQVVEAAYAVGLEDEVLRRIRVPVGRGFSGTIAGTREPLVVRDTAQHEIVSPVLREAGIRSMLGVPIVVKDELLGVLHVGTRAPRDFGTEEIGLLQVVADRMAVVLENQRLFAAERDARSRAEAAEARYLGLVNNLDRCIVWEADARTLAFTFVSMRTELVLGVPVSAWFGQPNFFVEHVHPADRDRVRSELRASAEDGQDRRFDHRMIRADGTPIWVHTGFAVGEFGGARAFHGITLDIHALKQAEERLHARVRQLVATAQLGQRALADPDLAGLMHDVVARLARDLAVDLVELLELTPDGANLLLRAGVGWDEGLVGHAVVGADHVSQGGYTVLLDRPVIVEDLAQESRFRPSRLLLEHGVVSGVSVVISGEERPLGVLGAHTRERRAFSADDVAFLQSIANLLAAAIGRANLLAAADAARLRAEEAERRLRVLYDASGALLGDPRDAYARVIEFTRRLAGAFADACCLDLAGQAARRRVLFVDGHPTGAPGGREHDVAVGGALPEVVAEVVRAGEARLFGDAPPEIRALCGDDAVAEGRAASAIVAPLRGREASHGVLALFAAAPRGFRDGDVALFDDIARRAGLAIDNAQLYEEAEAAARQRQELANIVAHDLRSSLTAVKLSLEAATRATLDERARRLVGRATAATDAMSRLMTSVLDAGKIAEGQLPLERRACDPGAAVRGVVDMLAPVAEARGLELRAEVPEDLPKVACDQDRIVQVFSNLIGNALKFTSRGGVHVFARGSGDEVVFSVSDTGPGIPPENLEHVFERFWQARETARGGSGLGLYIVKGIVEAHGGRVWAESPPGEGATFYVALPAEGRAHEQAA